MSLLQRLTNTAQELLLLARAEASRRRSLPIEVPHVLLALLEQENGQAGAILDRAHVSRDLIRQEAYARAEPKTGPPALSDLPFSAETKRVLQFAREEADLLGHGRIDVAHFLLAILREDSCGDHPLVAQHLTLETARDHVRAIVHDGSSS